MSRIDEIEALLNERMSELDELRSELAHLRREVAPPSTVGPAAEPGPEEAFGRRKLLGRMASVAAAGVGLAAAESLVHPRLAAADASTAAVFGNGATTKDGVEGVTNSATRSGVFGHNDGQGAGVYGVSAGVGVHASTVSTSKPALEALAPVAGQGLTATTGAGAPAAARRFGQAGSPSGSAIVGSCAATSNGDAVGVTGIVEEGIGVYGGSVYGTGIGAYTAGGTALYVQADAGVGISVLAPIPLYILPSLDTGTPTDGGLHLEGEVLLDAANDLYVCTAAGLGTAAVWKRVQYAGTGGGGAGLQVLTAPGRLMDTRGNGAPITHSSQKLAKGETFGLQVTGKVGVPAGATAVTGSIAVTQPEGAGYLRLFPAQLASSTTSVINFAPGQTIANAFTAALSPGGQLKVQAVDAKTHVIIDITGYVA